MTDLNLREIRDGYVPDLIVLDVQILDEVRKADARHLLPDQVGRVVEVTSRSNAACDRQPGPRRGPVTKWNGYAQTGIADGEDTTAAWPSRRRDRAVDWLESRS